MDRSFLLRPLFVCALMLLTAMETARAQEQENIKDNSFLIEEAYNQEPGVVQHIFNWYPTWDHTDGDTFQFLYTIELPLGSECHQFSATPMNFEWFHDTSVSPSEEEGGWGDTMINYRYQLMFENEDGWQPAI